MNCLKIQLYSLIEKQHKMKSFIKLKFVLKTALTNFQNISNKKKNLITLTIRLSINIKRHNNVITTLNERLKNFKNVCLKFFKKKNLKLSLQMKNLNVKKKNSKKNIIFWSYLLYLSKKKHYASNWFRFRKTRE